MSSNKKLERYSKFLSYVLRHRPGDIGIVLNEQGWVSVQDLITKTNDSKEFPGMELSLELVCEVVERDGKKRFSFSDDQTMIRANQGHSVSVDLGLPNSTPPINLFHGTVKDSLSSIREKGLLASGRHAVHLSADSHTAKIVGSRRGEAIILVIDSQAMHSDGHTFQCSENGVWLTERVPSKYIMNLSNEQT